MKIIHNISASIEESTDAVIARVLKQLQLSNHTPAYIYKESIDARHKSQIRKIYSIAIQTDLEHARLSALPKYQFQPKRINTTTRPLIVGMGPAGLFCGYILAKFGLRPILIDRGQPIERRQVDVSAFWSGKELNPESNVQFGEGGAGAFSDGKLVTRIHDSRCRYALEILVENGADPKILRMAKPHIGTDRLCQIVKQIRQRIIKWGGEVRFESKLTDIQTENGILKTVTINEEVFPCQTVVLAIGNGARDTYRMLIDKLPNITAKPFSVGFRMEHSQQEIDTALYGSFAKQLPHAEYQFSTHINKQQNQAVYTFCMCPGGQVINASSEPGKLVTNGMSLHARDGKNANAALLATVRFSTADAGIAFQDQLEQLAWQAANGAAPITVAKDFLAGTISQKLGHIQPTFLPYTQFYDFSLLYPKTIVHMLQTGLARFNKAILDCPDAVLTGVETRTSAPLRILRDESTYECIGIKGIYPCGEGAGYAGGITSSAVDGIRIAEAIIER